MDRHEFLVKFDFGPDGTSDFGASQKVLELEA